MLELLLKYGPAIVVAGGVIWKIIEWSITRADTLNREEDARVRQSQRPFLEKQLQFYFETARVTAKLASLAKEGNADKGPGHDETWDWAYRRFWELYWGELGVVESPAVAQQMVSFGSRLRQIQSQERPFYPTENELVAISLNLAQEIRNSIENSWGYALPETKALKGDQLIAKVTNKSVVKM